ncbi:MAG: protein-L-isoaspartate(D-aspartate) O-methyltransferase [bacterium]|nr:protein-L-isoaspartate(D-aspartate) O-methyltransferase [bacterium]
MKSEMKRLLEEIKDDARKMRCYLGKDTIDSRVLAALSLVPRHLFVPEDSRDEAYADKALSIGAEQTISQPFIVALMTDLLQTKPQDRILEIGTGSGYQAAVLSHLVKRVYSLEIVESLAIEAHRRLERLGYLNIETSCANGFYGWAEHAPYDGIIVTAATPEVPSALIEQLKPGGCLVIPVGESQKEFGWHERFGFQEGSGGQELCVFKKGDNGEIESRDVLPVRFVPFTGLSFDNHGI